MALSLTTLPGLWGCAASEPARQRFSLNQVTAVRGPNGVWHQHHAEHPVDPALLQAPIDLRRTWWDLVPDGLDVSVLNANVVLTLFDVSGLPVGSQGFVLRSLSDTRLAVDSPENVERWLASAGRRARFGTATLSGFRLRGWKEGRYFPRSAVSCGDLVLASASIGVALSSRPGVAPALLDQA